RTTRRKTTDAHRATLHSVLRSSRARRPASQAKTAGTKKPASLAESRFWKNTTRLLVLVLQVEVELAALVRLVVRGGNRDRVVEREWQRTDGQFQADTHTHIAVDVFRTRIPAARIDETDIIEPRRADGFDDRHGVFEREET